MCFDTTSSNTGRLQLILYWNKNWKSSFCIQSCHHIFEIILKSIYETTSYFWAKYCYFQTISSSLLSITQFLTSINEDPYLADIWDDSSKRILFKTRTGFPATIQLPRISRTGCCFFFWEKNLLVLHLRYRCQVDDKSQFIENILI